MGRFALISVSDKSGLTGFATRLIEQGFTIISTGGTHKSLQDAGIASLSVSEFTKFPEILDGRVKTLHPAIFAGLLAVLKNEEHLLALQELSLKAIDLVAVNLYPFKNSISKTTDPDEIIENIDIGAIIQPGGSKRDQEVIHACDVNEIAMLFTGKRHFRH